MTQVEGIEGSGEDGDRSVEVVHVVNSSKAAVTILPMKLVVLGPGHPFRGGIATTTTALVLAMRERGHVVDFLTPIRQYPRWLYPGGSGGRDAGACPAVEGAQRIIDPLNPAAWPRGRRAALAAGADVWAVPYWTWAWAGWWKFLLAADGPPVVGIVHNPVDHDSGSLARAAASAVLSRCRGLFTHAVALESLLAADYPEVPIASHPLPATSVEEWPDRDAARRAVGLPLNRRVAVFAGLIRPYKGVDLLLEAMACLPVGNDWLLLVAGEPWGEEGARLVRRTMTADLQGRVKLDLRWLNEAELGNVLAAADLLVLPYRGGSQSAMAPLALARGVPVLTTNVGGLPEVVRDGINGRVVSAGSVRELADALMALDTGSLKQLAAGARETSGRLTWAGYAEALEGLVRDVLGQPRQ